MDDNHLDRKHLVVSVVALLREKFGETFKTFSMSRQVREVVQAAPGLIQSDEIAIILRHVSGARPGHSLIANALLRAKSKGILFSPFKGVWGAVPDLVIPDTAEVLLGAEPDFDEAIRAAEGHVALLDRQEQADFDAWETEITNH